MLPSNQTAFRQNAASHLDAPSRFIGTPGIAGIAFTVALMRYSAQATAACIAPREYSGGKM
jgi:hypothetical protein